MGDGVQTRASRTRTVTRDYVDDVSGEIVRLSHEEAIQPRRRPGEDASPDAFTLFFNGKALAQLRIGQLAWRCLMWLTEEAPVGVPVFRYSNAEVAAALDSHPTKTSQAIRELRAAGLVIDAPGAPGDKRRAGVMLNPHYFWRGKPAERRKALWNTPERSDR